MIFFKKKDLPIVLFQIKIYCLFENYFIDRGLLIGTFKFSVPLRQNKIIFRIKLYNYLFPKTPMKRLCKSCFVANPFRPSSAGDGRKCGTSASPIAADLSCTAQVGDAKRHGTVRATPVTHLDSEKLDRISVFFKDVAERDS